MKTRIGYVSNSSSSSFIVFNADKLSNETKEKIIHYDEACYNYCVEKGIPVVEDERHDGYDSSILNGKQYHTEYGVCPECTYMNNDCRWYFRFNKNRNTIELCTYMDNFNMEDWLKILGVDFVSEGEFWFMNDENDNEDKDDKGEEMKEKIIENHYKDNEEIFLKAKECFLDELDECRDEIEKDGNSVDALEKLQYAVEEYLEFVYLNEDVFNKACEIIQSHQDEHQCCNVCGQCDNLYLKGEEK